VARRSKTISTPPRVKKPKRQQFSSEYKLEAVRVSREGTRTVAAVAADLGIAANQLHRWRRAHAESGVDAFPGNGKINSRDEELHRLRNELRRVTEERDVLKEATAFFAKMSR
jgi:transposase